MGRKPTKVDPMLCDHLIEHCRQSRLWFKRDHVPTFIAWLLMVKVRYEKQINELADRHVRTDPAQRAYRRHLVSANRTIEHLILVVQDKWDTAAWHDAIECMDELLNPDPADPVPDVLKMIDDGCPNSEV